MNNYSSLNTSHYYPPPLPNPLLLHYHPHLSSPKSNSINSPANPRKLTSSSIPARDRIIDFGKHKGNMLGTLSSNYLTWVSKNLRARDYEEWAKLADQVLQDPVYRDRIEWEFAEKLLNGNESSRVLNPVSELLEVSERFGWDNEDKAGWNRIDFGLLGTSKGARIPRIGDGGGREIVEEEKQKKKKKKEGEEIVGGGCNGYRRRERRERLKMRLKMEKGSDDGENVVNGGVISENPEGVADNNAMGMGGGRRSSTSTNGGNGYFPGRESLLMKAKKVHGGKRKEEFM